MRRILLVTILAVLVASGSMAQQENNIGVINPQRVLENSIEGKRVIQRLQEKNKELQTKIANIDEEIQKLETKMNTQRLTLTQEAVMALSSDLDKKRTERKRLSEDAQREINELQGRLFNRLQNELLPIVEEIGKEKNFDVIFDVTKQGAVVYFNPGVDITDEVIKRYDASKTK
ncbi:MAG: OmpH family outer membrane protein [Candidatus Aminicenantaceae bacterium]